MPARRAARIDALTHRAQHLGRDHHILARDAKVFDRLASHNLRRAIGIDIGGINKVHSRIER